MNHIADAPSHPRGLYFEELGAGQVMMTAARTVTETDVVNFAAMTGDWNPLHSDVTFAANSMFGRPMAHGTLGVALACGLVARLGILDGTAIAARGIDEWKFLRPIYPGDTIRVRTEVLTRQAVPHLGGGMVVFQLTVFNQDDEVVHRGVISVGLLSRPADGEGSHGRG